MTGHTWFLSLTTALYLLPAGTALLPVFSWATVPIFWHACNVSGPFNPAAVAFITGSGFASATIEKAQGLHGPDGAVTYAEDRITAAAAQLKAANPRLPVLAYFNSVLNWPYALLPGVMRARASAGPLIVVDGQHCV